MIDLVAHRILDISLYLSLTSTVESPSPSIFSELASIGGEQPESDPPRILFVTEYTKSRRRQHLTLIIVQTTAGELSLSLHATKSGQRGRGRGRTPFKPVDLALRTLGEAGVRATGTCQISFLLHKRRFKTLIPLPLTLFQESAFPFDRLEGFRLGSSGNAGQDRSLIVDTHENDLHLALSYDQEFSVDESLLPTAVTHSKQFIRPFLASSQEVDEWFNKMN